MAKVKKDVAVAFPELAEAFRSSGQVGAWSVEAGSSERGDAYTNFVERHFRIPTGNTEAERAVRAHELGHARISPKRAGVVEEMATITGLPARAVMCAEEARVNNYLIKKGIDLDALSDGTEKEAGIRCGTEALGGDYRIINEAICFGAGLVGTKAFRQYLAGVRKTNPDLALTLKEVEKGIKRVLRKPTHEELGGTYVGEWRVLADKDLRYKQLGSVVAEAGFVKYTSEILNVLRHFVISKPEEGEYEQVEGEGGVDYEVGNNPGKFAPLILDESVLCVQQVKGSLGRKKRASASGKTIAYPQRLITDPERRIFRDKAKVSGGIVVIDQSGSMDLTEENIEEILDISPGALIIGYSHRPGSVGVPNAWVIARRGKRVATGKIPEGKIGNGVDGPVLDYALKHRRGNEPVFWVCDGQVTDAFDKSNKELDQIVANIIIKNGITQVPTPQDAISALRSGSRQSILRGRVGLAIKMKRGGK